METLILFLLLWVFLSLAMVLPWLFPFIFSRNLDSGKPQRHGKVDAKDAATKIPSLREIVCHCLSSKRQQETLVENTPRVRAALHLSMLCSFFGNMVL